MWLIRRNFTCFWLQGHLSKLRRTSGAFRQVSFYVFPKRRFYHTIKNNILKTINMRTVTKRKSIHHPKCVIENNHNSEQDQSTLGKQLHSMKGHQSNPPSPNPQDNETDMFCLPGQRSISNESLNSSSEISKDDEESVVKSTSQQSLLTKRISKDNMRYNSESAAYLNQVDKKEEAKDLTSQQICNTSNSPSCLKYLKKYCRYTPWTALIAVMFVIKSLLVSSPNAQKVCSFSDMKIKYPNESDLVWSSLKTGTENILNGLTGATDVYLFLHNDIDFIHFINDVAKETSKCFDPQKEPFELNTDHFTAIDAVSDYGLIIDKFKKQVQENSAVIIADLNKIPARAARSLHSICDSYNPLVKNVIIFLTLNCSEFPVSILDNPVVVAHDILHRLWGPHLPEHELDALITRVTPQVFALKH